MKNNYVGYHHRTMLTTVLIFMSCTVFSQEYLDIRIAHEPKPVVIKGLPTIYYELLLTNFGKDSVVLKAIEVIEPVNWATIFLFNEEELTNRMSRTGVTGNDQNRMLPPGMAAVVYVELILPVSFNKQLVHQVEFESVVNEHITYHKIQGGNLTFTEQTQLVLGAPLRDGPWVAIYEPSWTRGHRRVVYTVDGQMRIPGRFAIDFIKVDHQGKYARDDDNLISNWFGYAADVLAVSDGVVVSARDDFNESNMLSEHPLYSSEQATGNYIAIDIGNGNFVFYEHLKPGSIKVKQGQKVEKGDVIGALGFTGQSTGPHLHFHVANRNSPLGAEGIPFVFEHFKVLGDYMDFTKFGKEKWEANSGQNVSNERPAPNTVVLFE
ncbi:hypothetical protein C900_02971 [Fulvivirga imtechensis AK7]|uniref:M23ase beta-sheet core domain-containing protein n=1 Tax=Fulvivirga imtechensis AK7 TaxID=1237149 RepID=L8JV91_9BACT|nr:M23 family metallopeptidase [Fulvivirga imtechensis]ELR71167.1 hypothetical protein C900_02971 [Fulvivirga imtechensis AK7]